EGADPETFELIEESTGLFYAKDKKKVYVYTKNTSTLVPVIGADPETFEVLECPYAKDKRDAYNGCLPLYVDDVEKFEVIEGYGGVHYSPLETFLGPALYPEEVVLYNIEKYGFLKNGPVLYSNGGKAKTDRQYFKGYRLIEEE
ncbi:MAG: DKNYY domain-containing protein, partial [Clostridia bacterium]|nr:DKNYY domain-containing protein [Clostridia bacterium]